MEERLEITCFRRWAMSVFLLSGTGCLITLSLSLEAVSLSSQDVLFCYLFWPSNCLISFQSLLVFQMTEKYSGGSYSHWEYWQNDFQEHWDDGAQVLPII